MWFFRKKSPANTEENDGLFDGTTTTEAVVDEVPLPSEPQAPTSQERITEILETLEARLRAATGPVIQMVLAHEEIDGLRLQDGGVRNSEFSQQLVIHQHSSQTPSLWQAAVLRISKTTNHQLEQVLFYATSSLGGRHCTMDFQNGTDTPSVSVVDDADNETDPLDEDLIEAQEYFDSVSERLTRLVQQLEETIGSRIDAHRNRQESERQAERNAALAVFAQLTGGGVKQYDAQELILPVGDDKFLDLEDLPAPSSPN